MKILWFGTFLGSRCKSRFHLTTLNSGSFDIVKLLVLSATKPQWKLFLFHEKMVFTCQRQYLFILNYKTVKSIASHCWFVGDGLKKWKKKLYSQVLKSFWIVCFPSIWSTRNENLVMVLHFGEYIKKNRRNSAFLTMFQNSMETHLSDIIEIKCFCPVSIDLMKRFILYLSLEFEEALLLYPTDINLMIWNIHKLIIDKTFSVFDDIN